MDMSRVLDYCHVFINCLDSHSDGTHSLHVILWWASDPMLNFAKSVLKQELKLICILDGLRVSLFFSTFSILGELFSKYKYHSSHSSGNLELPGHFRQSRSCRFPYIFCEAQIWMPPSATTIMDIFWSKDLGTLVHDLKCGKVYEHSWMAF